MLIVARDILQRVSKPDADTVRHELSGQICRCTGYTGIVKAIVAAGRDGTRGATRSGEMAITRIGLILTGGTIDSAGTDRLDLAW